MNITMHLFVLFFDKQMKSPEIIEINQDEIKINERIKRKTAKDIKNVP